MLFPGQPQTDHVRVQASNQYVYMYTKKFDAQDALIPDQITISITPSAGDPDLFVMVSNGLGEGGNGGRGRPGQTYGHYDYSSQQLQQNSDRIVIDTASETFNKLCDTNVPASDKSCLIQIGVQGYSASDYTIVVSQTSAITTLLIGTPFRGVADRKALTYYKASLPSLTAGLKLTLTQTSGSSALYVSCAPRQYPTQKNGGYDWSSSSHVETSASSILISADMMMARGCPRNPPGDMYIGVFNNSTQYVSTFSITATIEDGGSSTATSLVKGVPTSGDVDFKKITYYSVYVGASDAGNDLTLSTTVIAGDVDMYVSNSWASRPVFNAATNKVESYIYKSEALATEKQTLKIPNLNPTQQASYIIGVFGTFQSIPMDENCKDVLVLPAIPCQALMQSQVGCGNRACSCDRDFCPSCGANHNKCDATCGYCHAANQEPHGISSYRIVADTGTIIQLMDGTPLTATVQTEQYKYYSATVMSPNVDLTISLVSLNGGDPDLYLDVAPNRFPNETHYKYYSGSMGSDTYVLQASEILASCPQLGLVGIGSQSCTVYMSVFGFNSTRYTITSSFGYGYQSPTSLILGQTQIGFVEEGAYAYYKAVANPSEGQSISFTLITTDDGDSDLFLSASRENEPGNSYSDMEATGWAGTDTITIEPGDPLYCTGCTFYLAVYGYLASSYSIVYSSGLTSLGCGQSTFGNVGKNLMAYFSYSVGGDDDGDIEIAMTALTGDPDIYVSAGNGGVFPTKEESMWMRSSLGSDALTISTSDHNYCKDCTYIIGVYGWSEPSTFDLMASSGTCMLTLHSGRPQQGSQSKNTMRYYKISLRSSGDSLTTSLVMLYGQADMYIKKIGEGVSWNTVPLPDRNIPSTYDVTSKGQYLTDQLVFPGPFDSSATFLIGVHATTRGAGYLITASFNKSPIVLARGVPQVHFVEAGETEVFTFNVDRNDVDIIVTATAITGDPDLLISSTHDQPGCHMTDPVTSTRVCGNYTWMSADLGGDQITINHNAPCEPSGDGTIVDDSCDPRTVLKVGAFYVGAYGFSSTSKFSIMWSYVGGRTELVAGQPQLGSTNSAAVCPTRDEDTGECHGPSHNKQVAYFTFEVSPSDSKRDAHISISIMPECDATDGNWDPNLPGCSGTSAASVTAYVKWCVHDDSSQHRACVMADSFPTEEHYDFKESVNDGDRTVIFIANDKAHPNLFCNPATEGAPCIYYIAIETANNAPASFSVTASTVDDVTVVPCRPTPAPDGVINWGPDVVSTDSDMKGKGYEVCGTSLVARGTLDISLEKCTGNMAVMICAGDGACVNQMPSKDDFTAWSDSSQICTQSLNSKKDCVTNVDGVPRVKLIAAEVDSYLVKVEGQGKYNMKVASYLQASWPSRGSGIPMFHFDDDGSLGYPPKAEGSNTVLRWNPAHVNMNGFPEPVLGLAVDYEVYFVKKAFLDKVSDNLRYTSGSIVTTTHCGLENMMQVVREKYSNDDQAVGSVYVENPSTQVKISSKVMDPAAEYQIFVTAKCDEQCLLQVSTANAGATTTKCTVQHPCKTIRGLYQPVTFTTNGGGSVPEGGKTHAKGTILGALFGVIGALGLIAGIAVYVRRRRDSMGGVYDVPGFSSLNSRAPGGYMATRRQSSGFSDFASSLGPTFSPFFVGKTKAVDGSEENDQIDFAPNVARPATAVRADFAREFGGSGFGVFGGGGAASATVRDTGDEDMNNSIELGNMGAYRSPADLVLALKEDLADDEKFASL